MRRPRILSKMKRLEIVVEAHRLDEMLRIVEPHVTGFTVMPGVRGVGLHGAHDGDLALLVTVVTSDHLEAIVDAILPMLNERANIVTIADVAVLRAEHFIPEVRSAAGRDAR